MVRRKVVNAVEAAVMAVWTSEGGWSGIVAIRSPDEGSWTEKVSPVEEDWMNLLSMKG